MVARRQVDGYACEAWRHEPYGARRPVRRLVAAAVTVAAHAAVGTRRGAPGRRRRAARPRAVRPADAAASAGSRSSPASLVAMALWLPGGHKEWQAILWGRRDHHGWWARSTTWSTCPAPVKLAGQVVAALPSRCSQGCACRTSRCRSCTASISAVAARSLTIVGLVADHQRRQLLRRHRRARRGRLRDLRDRAVDHRVRPRQGLGRRARRDHRWGGARVPRPQLPPGVDLHGRLRVEPARLPAWAVVSVQGSLKTNALIALVIPPGRCWPCRSSTRRSSCSSG